MDSSQERILHFPLPDYFVDCSKYFVNKKRGRKATKSTKILSLFVNKSKEESPRKEFIRCCLLRRMVKLLRLVRNNKIKKVLPHPFLGEILNVLIANLEVVLPFIEKKNLPYVENKTNMKFKSYNDAFCKFFFSKSPIKEIYKLYVEYFFATKNCADRSKELGAYCCKEQCTEDFECQTKWSKLKELLVQEADIYCSSFLE